MDLLIFFNQSLPLIFFPFLFCLNKENDDLNRRSEILSFSTDLDCNTSLIGESNEKFKSFKLFLQKLVNFSHLGIILSFFGETFCVQIYRYHFFEELLLLLAGITWMVEIFVLNGEFKINDKYTFVKLFWILSFVSEVIIFGNQTKNMNKFYIDCSFFLCKFTRISFLATLNLYLLEEKLNLVGKYVFKLKSAQPCEQGEVNNDDFENTFMTNQNFQSSTFISKPEEEKEIKYSLKKKTLMMNSNETPLKEKKNIDIQLEELEMMEAPLKNNTSILESPIKKTPIKSKRNNKFEKLRILNKVCLTERKKTNTTIFDNNAQNSSGLYTARKFEEEQSSNCLKSFDFEIENVEILRNKQKIQYLFFLKCINNGRVKTWNIIKTYNEISELNTKLESNSKLSPKYFEAIPKVSSYSHATSDSFIEERRIGIFNYMNKIIKNNSLHNEALFKFLSFDPDRNTPYVISPYQTINQDSLVFSISFLSNHTYHPSPFSRSPKNLFFPKAGKTTHGISFQKVRIILSSIKGCIDDGTIDFKLLLNHYKQKTNISISCPISHPLGKIENEIFFNRSNSNEPKKPSTNEDMCNSNNSNSGAYSCEEHTKNALEFTKRKLNFTVMDPQMESNDFHNEEGKQRYHLKNAFFLRNTVISSEFSEEILNSPHSENKKHNTNFQTQIISFQNANGLVSQCSEISNNVQHSSTPIQYQNQQSFPFSSLKTSCRQQSTNISKEIDKFPLKKSRDVNDQDFLQVKKNSVLNCNNISKNDITLNENPKTQPENSLIDIKYAPSNKNILNSSNNEKPSTPIFFKYREEEIKSGEQKVSAKNVKNKKNENFLFFVYCFLLEERWENLWEPRTTIKFTRNYEEIKNMHKIICNLGQNFDMFQDEATVPEDLKENEIGLYDEPKYRQIKVKWEEYFEKVLKIPGIEENESFKSFCCLDRLKSGWEFNRLDIENLDYSMY